MIKISNIIIKILSFRLQSFWVHVLTYILNCAMIIFRAV